MNKTVSYCSVICAGGLLLAIALLRPDLLSDKNTFLKDFVNQNILSILGVILTITLASAAQIHLALNEAESKVGRPFLNKTRAGVHSSSYFLIWLFLISVVVAIIKPYFAVNETGQSIFNATAIFILFWMVLIMASLMRLVFAIKPHYPEQDD